MRRSRSLFIFIVATFILCLVRSTICDESTINKKSAGTNETKIQEKPVVNKGAIDEHKKNNTSPKLPTGTNITVQSVSPNIHNKSESVTKNVSPTPEQPVKEGHQPTVNSGALLRGFYVLAGLSVIALAYMVFRSFGINKQRPQMVRKYGVLAHKQDIEMRPLPLDEDDDDDTTVFDVSGLSSARQQS